MGTHFDYEELAQLVLTRAVNKKNSAPHRFDSDLDYVAEAAIATSIEYDCDRDTLLDTVRSVYKSDRTPGLELEL